MPPLPAEPAEPAPIHSVTVADLRRARAWYADSLRATAPGPDEVVAFLGTHVRLVASGEPSHVAVVIAVADCRSTYEALRERGVPFLTEPIERGCDTRCTFRDPDDNLFELREVRG